MSDADDATEIDAIGLRCPLPVLRLQQALRDRAPGTVVTLLASDAMAAVDVPHFCAEGGHDLLATSPRPDLGPDPGPDPGHAAITAYRVRRGG